MTGNDKPDDGAMPPPGGTLAAEFDVYVRFCYPDRAPTIDQLVELRRAFMGGALVVLCGLRDAALIDPAHGVDRAKAYQAELDAFNAAVELEADRRVDYVYERKRH